MQGAILLKCTTAAFKLRSEAGFSVLVICRQQKKRQSFSILVSRCLHQTQAAATSTSKRPVYTQKLLLLNLLSALYGLGNVVSKVADDSPAGTPSCLVKYTSASFVFLPTMVRCIRERDCTHVQAGVELGIWTFAHGVLSNLSPSSTNPNSTSLLYALTIVVVPALQLKARSSSTVMLLASFSSLFGMGLLEEEGHGWKGILPSSEDPWSLLEAAFSILQMLRSEALGKGRDPAKLQAIQLTLLSLLSFLWHTFQSSGGIFTQAQHTHWLPLLFSGLVCSGLGTLLEIRGLQGVDGSTMTFNYTMIPLWGALFNMLQQGKPPAEVATFSSLLLVLTRLCFFVSSRKSLRQREHQPGDHLPSVILSSQLKFPYYANQAQALLASSLFSSNDQN